MEMELESIMNGRRSHDFIRTPPATIDDHLHHHHPLDYQFFSGHENLRMTMNDRFSEFPSDCATGDETGLFGIDSGGGDGHTRRWQRQETLILLEIRSRLDSQFKKAIQKGPLWDQVSRIMFEEHGYQRSGRKCREKFENMHKYYKKTKDQAGKTRPPLHHVNQYRFFSQFNALCRDSGEAGFSVRPPESCFYVGNSSLQLHSSSNTPSCMPQKPHENSQDLLRTSGLKMKDEDLGGKRRKKGGRWSWKAKRKGFIDSQIKRLIEKQDSWLREFMKAIQKKERERIQRDEECRKQEKLRIDTENRLWEEKRSWIEARDVTLLERLLQKCLTNIDRRETLHVHNVGNLKSSES